VVTGHQGTGRAVGRFSCFEAADRTQRVGMIEAEACLLRRRRDGGLKELDGTIRLAPRSSNAGQSAQRARLTRRNLQRAQEKRLSLINAIEA
jgi:hypothetical protein